jgi:hypothetical protein
LSGGRCRDELEGITMAVQVIQGVDGLHITGLTNVALIQIVKGLTYIVQALASDRNMTGVTVVSELYNALIGAALEAEAQEIKIRERHMEKTSPGSAIEPVPPVN